MVCHRCGLPITEVRVRAGLYGETRHTNPIKCVNALRAEVERLRGELKRIADGDKDDAAYTARIALVMGE